MVDSTNLPNVDINQIATDLNNKMDRDGVNATCPMVISRERQSDGGIVEIWSDGFCVQSGIIELDANKDLENWVVYLHQEYIDTNYIVSTLYCNQNSTYTRGTEMAQYNTIHAYAATINTRTTSTFRLNQTYKGESIQRQILWRAEGYIR